MRFSKWTVLKAKLITISGDFGVYVTNNRSRVLCVTEHFDNISLSFLLTSCANPINVVLTIAIIARVFCLLGIVYVWVNGAQGSHSPGPRAKSMGVYPIQTIKSQVLDHDDVSDVPESNLPALIMFR